MGVAGQEMRVIEPSLSLKLPAGTTFDEWLNIGRNLYANSAAINWHIGDWWAFGDHRYGARAKAAAEGLFGLAFQTLRNAGTIARSFEVSRRRDVVSWAHHAEVAALPAPIADQFLEKAELEGMSRNELRREVNAYRSINREGRKRDIIDIRPDTPEPACAEFLSLDEVIVELAEALGRERALTDRESDFLIKAILRLQQADGRQTMAWTGEEDLSLISMLKEGRRVANIAPEFGRTERAVWKRVTQLGGVRRIIEQAA